MLAHVPYIIGAVHLDLKSIRIIELERFFRVLVRKLQVKFGQPGTHFISVEVGNPEVVVIDGGGLMFALLNTEEGIADAQDVYRRRLLPQGHPEELLVELRGAVKVRNPHSDVVEANSAEACRRRGRCERTRRRE